MHIERYRATISLAQSKLALGLILNCNSEDLQGSIVDGEGRERPLTLGHVFGDKVAFRGTFEFFDTESQTHVTVPFHCYATRVAGVISGLVKTESLSLQLVGRLEDASAEPDVQPTAA